MHLYALISGDGRLTRWSTSEQPSPWVVIETDHDPMDIYVWQGVASLLPPMPPDAGTFDPASGEWVLDPARRIARLLAAINAERDRRVLLGAQIEVSGYGPIPVQGGPVDQINLLALGGTATDLIAAGVTAAVIPFRDGVNVMHNLTPTQMKELVQKGKMVVSAIYAASWALKDADPIPEDYLDDTHWP